jgi:uncharacterized protein (DUF58 family)
VILLFIQQQLGPSRGWWILFVALLGLWLVAYLWARSLARGLKFERQASSAWSQVGEEVRQQFILDNESRLPASWIELHDHSTLPGARAGLATSMGGLSWEALEERLTCLQRGVFPLGPTTIRTGDPFGIYTTRLQHPTAASLMVLPRIIPLPVVPTLPGGPSGDGRTGPASQEQTVDAGGVREYVPGDSLRAIHWPTSARRDGLYVRLFDSAPARRWWIVLDMFTGAHVGDGPTGSEECAVTLAASLADEAVRLGEAVGLATHGLRWTWLPPQRGEEQRWRILRALAQVSPGASPLATVLQSVRRELGENPALAIVTPATDEAWTGALMPLIEWGATLQVWLLDPVTFGGEGDAGRLASRLARLQIPSAILGRDLFSHSQPAVSPLHSSERSGTLHHAVSPEG